MMVAEAVSPKAPADETVAGACSPAPAPSGRGGESAGAPEAAGASAADLGEAPRTRWRSRSNFVMVLMGYSIGIGNLWRFPYLCGRYGGGAFLVAYLIMLFVAAAPLFFIETVLGQKFQLGPAETFRRMAPRWTGLAYVPLLMTVFYIPFYQVVITYAFHYFLASFSWPLPWIDGTTPDRYLYEVVLQRAESLNSQDAWQINWRLLGELLAVWVITAMCLIKGIHSAGKAAFFTVLMPVVMISILFVACIGLEGAGDGLRYYLVPRWSALLSTEVWGLATGQIIFSLSPGMGTCIAMASYHERSYRKLAKDCALVAISNSAFSIFGGFVVFSVVGHLAHTHGNTVEEVADSGEGLAFIVFAQGLVEIGGRWSQVLAIMFFFTLFLLGLDSSFAVVETVQTYVNDWLLAHRLTSKITARGNACRLFLISTVWLIVGIPYVTRGGYILLEIADHYIVTYSLSISVLLEYIMIGHVYTAEQMVQDVYDSTGIKLSRCFGFHLKFIAPVAIGFVIALLISSEITGNAMEAHPRWAVWLFGIIPTVIALSAVAWPLAQAWLQRRLLAGGAKLTAGLPGHEGDCKDGRQADDSKAREIAVV